MNNVPVNDIEHYAWLRINTRTAYDALPITNANITVYDNEGNELYSGITNENGFSETFRLSAPSVWESLDPNTQNTPYSTVDVAVSADGFVPIRTNGVQLFDMQTSLVRLYMLPQELSQTDEAVEWDVIDVPPPGLMLPPRETPVFPSDMSSYEIEQQVVQIPEFITVHLGEPGDASAKNIRIRFTDYIKNVIASEMYPTFPYDALITGIHTAVTLALNRIYTSWYRDRGYDFDITSSPDYDQYYRYGANYYFNTNTLVDEYFDMYAHRTNETLPFFPVFCNGSTQTCDGLSIWGTVDLANKGYTPLNILQNYYGDDVILSRSPSIEGLPERFSGIRLRFGGTGDEVLRLQEYLNAVSKNYPLIPRIEDLNGTFGTQTDNAVRAFQEAFNLFVDGIVGKYTWNRLMKIYISIITLYKLYSEFLTLSDRIRETPPDIVLRQGGRGEDVRILQFMLNFISIFNKYVTPEVPNGIFGPSTRASIVNFQKAYNIEPDGVVGPQTWAKLYDVVKGIEENVYIPIIEEEAFVSDYPGTPLSIGSTGDDVLKMQEYLYLLSLVYPDIPRTISSGVFEDYTRVAVLTFQNLFMLPPTGVIDEDTWNSISMQYNLINR